MDKRDLASDLAICEAAALGNVRVVRSYRGDKLCDYLQTPEYDGIRIHWGEKGGAGTEESHAKALFFAGAVDALPHAIRRAMAAEDELKRRRKSDKRRDALIRQAYRLAEQMPSLEDIERQAKDDPGSSLGYMDTPTKARVRDFLRALALLLQEAER